MARLGFAACEPAVKTRLEAIGEAVLDGYHAALFARDAESLAAGLEKIPQELQGFAHEGAAMSAELLDRLTPWPSRRWVSFLGGPGAAHPYMVHVGAGLALARLKKPLRLPGAEFDPLLCWLVADGYGFHEGFFHPGEADAGRTVAGRIHAYARRAYDQGLGRSLWFSCGADPQRIDAAVRSRDAGRWPDLWSGIGLACAYAGGPGRAAIESLRALAEPFEPELAQGAAFAAQARARAANPAPHTDLACRLLCGCAAAAAAETTVRALEGLPADAAPGEAPAYEVWRRRVQARFGAGEAA